MIYPPRLNLATLPTPLVKLSRFSERLGGVNLWIKRDEMTGVEVSGNKIRKLEFCIAEAQRQQRDQDQDTHQSSFVLRSLAAGGDQSDWKNCHIRSLALIAMLGSLLARRLGVPGQL